MALVTLDEASARLGVARGTIEDWARQGLVTLRPRLLPENPPPGSSAEERADPCVEEDQLVDVAESLGWLQLSGDGWDGEE